MAAVPTESADALRTLTGPRGMPLFGSVFDVWRDPLGFFVRGVRDHGDIVRFRFGPWDYVLINDPEAVRHVLVENARGYQKSRSYDALRLVLGNGLVTSEGEFWRRQRKLAQPAFHKKRLVAFADVMAKTTEEMLAEWDKQGPTTFDLHEEMMALTLRIVGRALFGVDLAGDARAIGEAVSVGIKHANDFAEAIIKVPPWIPTVANVRFKRAVKVLDAMVMGIIEERRKQPNLGDDLLAMLMSARDDEGKGMTDRQLRDEVMTLVLAGHETTANALSWTFSVLSRHVQVDRDVHREAASVLGDRVPSFDDLPSLAYTAKVVAESLRLYPPVWVFEREAIEDDVVGGYAIRRGTIVAVSPWALHRNPKHWPNPEGFDPERFDPAAVEARAKCAYLPFATGPRQCIGDAFAKMEAQIVLAAIARKWRFEHLPGALPEPDAKVTLRPRGGLPMRRVRR
ncbi:MAG: cytochrome P450 [Polyangiales bacterium]